MRLASGTYSNQVNKFGCNQCKGKVSLAGATQCIDAFLVSIKTILGRHDANFVHRAALALSPGAHSCSLCPVGKIQPQIGSLECLLCAPGILSDGRWRGL